MNRLFGSLVLATLIALTACSSHDTSPALPGAAPGRTTLDVLGGAPPRHGRLDLFDAPLVASSTSSWSGSFSTVTTSSFSVVLHVLAVSLLSGSTETPWISLSTPQDVNLLALQSTAAEFSGTMPGGSYDGVRIIVDLSRSYYGIGSLKIPMQFPWQRTRTGSAPSVINIDAAVPAFTTQSGDTSTDLALALDFNVFESLAQTSSTAVMTPKLVGGVNAAAITGTVLNKAGRAVSNATIVVVDADGRTVNTTVTNGTGAYRLNGIVPGSYTLQVLNTYTSSSGTVAAASGNDVGAAPAASVTIKGSNVQLNALRD